MAYTLKSNPEGCVNPHLRGEKTCLECYWSQTKNASWVGSQRCWDANCIVLAVDVLTPSQRQQMNL